MPSANFERFYSPSNLNEKTEERKKFERSFETLSFCDAKVQIKFPIFSDFGMNFAIWRNWSSSQANKAQKLEEE